MKKKQEIIESKPGFTALTGFIGNCVGCGVRLEAKASVYWRKIDGKSQVFCRECADL